MSCLSSLAPCDPRVAAGFSTRCHAHHRWAGQPIRAHWGIPDPAAIEGSDDEKRRAFQAAFMQLSNRINLFLALPIEALEREALIARLRTIGAAEASH